MPNSQDVRDALYRLSNELDLASTNAAFLQSGKLQLVDAHQRLVWLLTRLKQNDAYVDQQAGIANAVVSTDQASAALDAVDTVEEGPPAIAQVFAALVLDDALLPLEMQTLQ